MNNKTRKEISMGCRRKLLMRLLQWDIAEDERLEIGAKLQFYSLFVKTTHIEVGQHHVVVSTSGL